MAEWGKGDPRWIVEDRPDATNVNNWHWTEKNASQWSKDKLTELLVNLKINDETGAITLVELVSCDGEAIANNRKAKLIFFYEWVIKMKWKGFLNGKNSEINGTLEIPNLSEENEPKDVDVNVTVDVEDSSGLLLKEILRNKGVEVIRNQLATYIKCLKEEFAQDMILPTKETSSTVISKPTIIQSKTVQSNKLKGDSNVQQNFDTEKLTMKESMKCTAEDFYRALTTQEMVQAFTRSACVLEPIPGGRFELFGGNVSGTFSKLVPNSLISQKWRFKNWPSGYYSDVIIEINQKEDSTQVNLIHTGIPKFDFEKTKEGWQKFYWTSMKRTFGFGAMIL